MMEGTPLKEHFDELRDFNVKIEDKDLTMILLASLPPSYENFVSSLSIGKNSIALKEVKSNLYSREFGLKASGNGDETSAFGLSMTDSTKGKKKNNKDKGGKKSKTDPKDICNYFKEPNYWKQDCLKKSQKYFIVALV